MAGQSPGDDVLIETAEKKIRVIPACKYLINDP
jgi:hypothetical protein